VSGNPTNKCNGWCILVLSLLCGFLVLSYATVAAQNEPYKADENWKKTCAQAVAQPPPSPLPGAANDRLAGCDESKLYYGLGDPPDYPGALQCGWFQYAHPQREVGNMFYGPGVLSMLYANAKGTAADYDLAVRFACENIRASDGEMAFRVGHLEFLRDNPGHGIFDLCDDITSGSSDGACTSIQTRTRDSARAKNIQAIAQKLSPAASRVFPALQTAESAFEDARIYGEVDLSGTSRAAFGLREQAKLRDQFLINLQRFSRNDTPTTSKADLALLNGKLKEAYQRLQDAPAKKWQFGTIKPDGIRETQLKWMTLLDAWVDFARLAYPELSETSLRAQLIRLRLHQLRSLYRE